MKLTTNARILTADGKDIGSLTRFVLDPLTQKVTHIVFEHGGLLDKTEYLIPMPLLHSTDELGIHLDPLPVQEVQELPRFEITKYNITNEAALLDRGYVSDEMIHGYYPSAPGGAVGILHPNDMSVFSPLTTGTGATQIGAPGESEPPVQKEVNTNIPDGTVAIKEGAKVISSDAKDVGSVEKVFIDSHSTRATHLLITKGLLTKEKKLIPTEWIKEAGGKEVYLNVPEDSLKELPEYDEK